MILDSLQNASLYYALNPFFEKAFNYLNETDFTTMEPGRYDIQGDDLFAIVSEAAGIKKADAKLEVHRKYWDIQFIVSGTDHMGWKAMPGCSEVHSEYNVEKDFALFSDKAQTWFDVLPGNFTIFFPTDAHAPMTTEETVRKVVLKVKAF